MIGEIETTRPRIIEVKLTDDDAKCLCEMAGAHGLTVGKLIENFIEDLVDGPHSNGSDERMYAQQWFERCGFGMFSDFTFLSYLIDCGELDTVIGTWKDIKNTEEYKQILAEHWNEYTQQKEYEGNTFEEEMEKVLDYWKEYQRFLRDDFSKMEKPILE